MPYRSDAGAKRSLSPQTVAQKPRPIKLLHRWIAALCRCPRGVCAPARRSATSGRVVRCDHSGCRPAAKVRPWWPRLEGAPLLQLALESIPDGARRIPLRLPTCPGSDHAPVAGVQRQQQLLASARRAAGGLLAGLAAATVTLSAGPAGAEVRMPPIDRNGEPACQCEGGHNVDVASCYANAAQH